MSSDFAPDEPLPPFRSLVKVVPVQHEGRDAFLVVDSQEGIFEHQVLLPPLAFAVAAFLDGRRTLAGVRRALEENLPGLRIEDHEIEDVVRNLDRHYLLESPRLQERRRQIQADYLALPSRPARFVQGTPEEVRKELDALYVSREGAGKPGPPEPDRLLAIMAPHIDLARGGTCYTFAYRQIAERSDADLYVILAVAHLAPPAPFILTGKDYQTALGTVPTDPEIVTALRKRLGEGPFEYEVVHRTEHSAEFQALMLKHARPAATFTIVPILCSSFEAFCGTSSPSTVPLIEDFLGALAEAVRGRRVCYVAGVDLSHVGPAFGDDVEINPQLLQWMGAGDERFLAACAEGSAEGFWNAVMADGNRQHVCGLSATYTLLRLLGEASGEILKYGHALDPSGGIVSFASMAFRPRSRILLP